MKYSILYILFSCMLFSCKIDKKHTSNQLVATNTVSIDSIVTKAQEKNEQESKTLKEKLIGRVYRKTYEIAEFENYSSGGFLVGSTFNNEHIINGKEYSIKIINGSNEDVLYLIFNELHHLDDEGKAYFKIIDLLEIENYTKSFDREEIDKLDIFSDVLLNGERAPELLALAEYEETDILTKIYKVWRANRKLGKFEEVKNLSGITVSNEDY